MFTEKPLHDNIANLKVEINALATELNQMQLKISLHKIFYVIETLSEFIYCAVWRRYHLWSGAGLLLLAPWNKGISSSHLNKTLTPNLLEVLMNLRLELLTSDLAHRFSMKRIFKNVCIYAWYGDRNITKGVQMFQ